MSDRLPLIFESIERGARFHFSDAALATAARRLFIEYLRAQVEADCDLFNVELVFGEILGNVARHAPGPVDVEFVWEEARARLEVWDHGPGYEGNIALPDLLEESHRGLFLVAQCADDLRVERRAGRTVTSVMLPIKRAEVRMNDSTSLLAPASHRADEVPPEVAALRLARLRAAEVREAAERALREAETAEAQLALQEEQAIAAVAAAKREVLTRRAQAATTLEQKAIEALAVLQSEIQHATSAKAQTEAAVAALRASLMEHEEQLREAEASERKLQGDLTNVELAAQECVRARQRAEVSLQGMAQRPVVDSDLPPAPAASKPEPPPPSLAAQRAAERRAADAARTASG